MKSIFSIFLVVITHLGLCQTMSFGEIIPLDIVYTSPSHLSTNHSPQTQIILKSRQEINGALYAQLGIEVRGANNRIITGKQQLIGHQKVISFIPDKVFNEFEAIKVTLYQYNATANSKEVVYQFGFRTGQNPRNKTIHTGYPEEIASANLSGLQNKELGQSPVNFNELPQDFPTLNITVNENPNPGYYFMAGLPIGLNPRIYMCIIDNDAMPVFYQKLPNRAFDFRKQENGMISYFSGTESKFRVLDSAYQVTDHLEAVNGYVTDSHELIIEDDGSYWLIALDVQQIDMSQIVNGGNPNANVAGNVIQHIDSSGNILFQWRSWDHMEITDCDTRFVNLTASYIDYVHANALSFDNDGNILLSSRHLNEITKINALSGEIIWRWGGNMNQFSFSANDEGFYGQHSIRYNQQNNSYTLFDNGNWHVPERSKGMEYQLNQIGLSANLIATYKKNEPPLYANAMGHFQRLDDGGSIVGWSGNDDFYVFTEYDAYGQEVFEIVCPDTAMVSYRVFKFNWTTNRFRLLADSLDFGEVELTDSAILELDIINPLNSSVDINGFHLKDSAFSILSSLPLNIQANDTGTLLVSFKPDDIKLYSDMLYVFHSTDTSRIAQKIKLSGGGLIEGLPSHFNGDLAGIHIFPNPATDIIQLSSVAGIFFDQVKIFSTGGTQVFNQYYSPQQNLSIPISFLPTGFYSVLVYGDAKTYHKKLMVH